jgi:hypothetical protein
VRAFLQNTACVPTPACMAPVSLLVACCLHTMPTLCQGASDRQQRLFIGLAFKLTHCSTLKTRDLRCLHLWGAEQQPLFCSNLTTSCSCCMFRCLLSTSIMACNLQQVPTTSHSHPICDIFWDTFNSCPRVKQQTTQLVWAAAMAATFDCTGLHKSKLLTTLAFTNSKRIFQQSHPAVCVLTA